MNSWRALRLSVTACVTAHMPRAGGWHGRRYPEEASLPELECPQAAKAAAWAAGSLDMASQIVYRKHLAHCPCCTAELAAFQRTVAQVRAIPAGAVAEPAPDLTDRIMAALPPDAFRVTPVSRAISFVRRHRQPLAAAAAAAVLACGAGALFFAQHLPVNTDRAAHAGCAWIARQQESDGSWDPVKGGGSYIFRPALTALASLALRQEPVRYANEIAAACSAMQHAQAADGAFGPEHAGRMYNHALATWALLAAYDNGRHPELKDAIDKAVAFIRIRQQPAGGWGYSASADAPANTAITAWQLQVLARAQQAGWSDAGGHLRKGLNWLQQRADKQGQFGYTASRDSASGTPTLNAMSAYTLLTAGSSRPELMQIATAAMDHIRSTPQEIPAREADLYCAFFTVAAWEASGDRTRANAMRAGVCARRETRGANKGSWAPADNWSKVGGRLYATSLAVLTLQPRQPTL
ncbi:MAG: hypothetical protein WCR06_04145 [bacterium]